MPINEYITVFNNLRYKEDFPFFALNVVYSYKGAAFLGDLVQEFHSGNANRVKQGLQDILSQHDYEAIWKAWSTIDPDKMIKTHARVYKDLCNSFWYLYKHENDPSSKSILSHRRRDDLRHDYVTSHLARIDKKEFIMRIKKKIMRDFPIPEDILDGYLEYVVY